jgi:lysophospholipase L1-like esterase
VPARRRPWESRGTAAADGLHSAQRTAHVAPGNQAGSGPLASAEPFSSLYWIARVLTDAPPDGPVIVAFGDSITRGDGTTIDSEQRYPDHLQARLLAAGIDGAAVLNAGLGANRLLRPQVGPPMTGRLARDVLSIVEATHVIIMGGLNDIGLPAVLGGPRPAAAQLIDALFHLARRASEHGIQPVLGTLTPIRASRYDSFLADGNEDIRQAVNHAIMTQRDWPTADFSAALADPDDPSRIAAAFDSGDGVHPADTGAYALADAINLTAFSQDRPHRRLRYYYAYLGKQRRFRCPTGVPHQAPPPGSPVRRLGGSAWLGRGRSRRWRWRGARSGRWRRRG